MNLIFFFLIFFGFFTSGFCQIEIDQYYENEKKIRQIKDVQRPLPIIYNQLCQSGYFTMPSAKMADSGTVAFSYSNTDPYKIIGLNFQYFSRVEITGNFWIYKNILEGNFGHLGYGEDADRAVNIKFAVLSKLDGFKFFPEIAFPEIAIGLNDFYGSKRFYSKYIVLTKQFIDKNLEFSIGYGKGRIEGFFSGLAFFHFFKKNKFINNFSFVAEYDGNDYKNSKHEHPRGRKSNCPINAGFNFQLFNIFQASINSIRGNKIAGGVSLNYNLGSSKGLFPKFLDPPVYKDYSYLDNSKKFSGELIKVFKDQGLDLIRISHYYNSEVKKVLNLKIVNLKYRNENILRSRIQNILSFIPSEKYSQILITVESDGLDLHEYCFKEKHLLNFSEKKIGLYELQMLCPMQNVSLKNNNEKILYERKKRVWTMTFHPKVNAFFGSCKKKFEYDGGFLLCQEGYFFNQLYYNLQMSYIIKAGSAKVGSRDVYNPSSILNVRSDIVKYYETNSFHVDSCFLQKNWNLKNGFFLKLALGYFEVAYAGGDFEFLYYPVGSNFALSFEAANVYKRKYGGVGFQKKVRKWANNIEEYEDFIGFQYFMNLFYEIKPLNLTIKTQAGQFLAKDKGIKIEFIKFFQSGFEFSWWITFTDKYDRVNNKRYFDKGFAVSIPLDLFMNKTSRKRFVFKMSEWQRDVGAKAKTGKALYNIIHDERFFP